MKKNLILFACGIILCASCKKNVTSPKTLIGEWNWTIEKYNNQKYNKTPQNTGIQENLWFNTNGTYSLTQNNVVVNEGTYTTSIVTGNQGNLVTDVLFTNTRVKDSIASYLLITDSLYFSPNLMGSVGASTRHYGRQK